jgi:hydrogenase nickel incorporation protein HypA/HybF
MHEAILVEGIISALLEISREKGKHVDYFKVGVGELSQFNVELIRYLLTEMVKGTELENTHVDVEVEEAIVKCLSCGFKLSFQELIDPLSSNEKEAIHFLPELISSFCKCPLCSMSDFEIEQGRGVRIVEVRLDV